MISAGYECSARFKNRSRITECPSRREGRLLDLSKCMQITDFPKPLNVHRFIIVRGLKIGANGGHSPTHFPALMQLGDFLERVVVDQN